MEHPTPDGLEPPSADWLAERLEPFAAELGVGVPAEALQPLAVYVRLVLTWGQRTNLTGARTAEVIADEHVADALALLPWLPEAAFRLLDVGSGAGLPGLVLALLRPDAEVVLLEPRKKRQAFLAHAIRELGLRGRVQSRAERLEDHRAATPYDVAVSRATWPAAEWLERAAGAVRVGGRVIGLEGAERGPLPAGAQRHPYTLAGRARAVVLRERTA